jgi:hypothetical protein
MKHLFSTCWRRIAQGGVAGLALVASGGAWAQAAPACTISVVSISGTQAVLKGNCTAALTSINWMRNLVSMSGDVTINVAATQDTFFTAALGSNVNAFAFMVNNAANNPCNIGTLCTIGTSLVSNAVAVTTGQPVAGACGTVAASAAQPAASCSAGTASSVQQDNTNNAWNWTCAGLNNGSVASCSAPMIVDGNCGSASGTTPLSAPPGGLAACRTGTVANVVTGTNSFTWSCNGANGGANATTCSAPVVPTPGACNPALNGQNLPVAPTAQNGCTTGTFTGLTTASGNYNWTCNGLGGGSSQSCVAFPSAPPVNGACGNSNGGTFSSAPGSALCNAGLPSGVTGTGPWSWTCSGSNGGTPASCSANLGGTTNPPPTNASCNAAAGQVFGAGDIALGQIQTVSLFPQPPLAASGPLGTAVAFTVDAVTYPNGLVLRVFDDSPNPVAKDIVVSACPHSFTPLNNQAVCQITPLNPQTTLRFNPAIAGCTIQAGTTYYINVRPNTPGNAGTTFLQIGAGLPSPSSGLGGLFGF